MKEKVKFLILGILIGAVITAGVFILIKNNASPRMMDRNFEKPQFEDGNFQPDIPEERIKDGNSILEEPTGAENTLSNASENTSK